jgi:hypothetical protein
VTATTMIKTATMTTSTTKMTTSPGMTTTRIAQEANKAAVVGLMTPSTPVLSAPTTLTSASY